MLPPFLWYHKEEDPACHRWCGCSGSILFVFGVLAAFPCLVGVKAGEFSVGFERSSRPLGDESFSELRDGSIAEVGGEQRFPGAELRCVFALQVVQHKVFPWPVFRLKQFANAFRPHRVHLEANVGMA